MTTIAQLEKLLANGHDTSLVRFGLASSYLELNQPEQAILHAAQAIALDPCYTAAWQLYGKALAKAQQTEQAIAAYEQGIRVAEQQGDRQALKMMQIFLKRLQQP